MCDEADSGWFRRVEAAFLVWSQGDKSAIDEGGGWRGRALENVVQHVRLRVLQDAGEAGREVERSLARALSVLFSTVPLHVVLFFLEYAVPQIAVLGEEESQFVRSRGAAKDPADRHGC